MATNVVDELHALEQQIRERHLASLWNITADDVPHEPVPRAVVHHWPYADTRMAVDEATRVVAVGAPETERRVMGRVVGLNNQGTESEVATTDTLFAGIQIMQPGEWVAAHRHSMSAVRFGLEGDGVMTSVDDITL